MPEERRGQDSQPQSFQGSASVESPPSVKPEHDSRLAGVFRLRPLNKIAVRLLLWASGLALIPIGILVWVSLDQAKEAIYDEALRKLMLVASERHNRIEEHVRQIRNAVQDEGTESFVIRLFTAPDESQMNEEVLRAQLGEALRPLVGADVDVFVADMAGRVIASTDPNRVGADCGRESYFLQARNAPYISDIFYDSVAQRMVWVAAAPVVNQEDRSLLGVLFSQIDPGHLAVLLGGHEAHRGPAPRQSDPDFQGRIYLFDRTGRLLTRPPGGGLDSLPSRSPDAMPVRYALDKKQSQYGDYIDSRQVRVVGAAEYVPDMKWVVLAEVDYSDAMARYARFRNAIIALALVVFGLTLAFALRLGVTIVRPLRDLVRAEQRLAEGDDSTALVPDDQIPTDEIGQLIRQRNVVIQRVLATEKRHRDLVDEIDGIAWEAEVGTWRFTFVNRRAEQILGYAAEQWLSEPGFWVRHLHPLDRSRTVQAYLEASITGKDLRLEYRMIASDGHPVWLRDQAHLVPESFASEGRPVRQLRGLMIDITAAKQAQDLLQESERRARTIIDMSHSAMIGIDSKGDVSVFNRAAEQMFQVAAREVIGSSMIRLVPEQYRDRHTKSVAHYLETGRSSGVIGQPHEMEGLRNDGTVFPMEISLTPTKDKSIRVIAVIQDVTARRRADEELRQRFRQLDGIHELTSALMNAESIEEIYAQTLSCVKIALRSDRASILLSDPDGPMRFKAWDGLSDTYRAAMEGRMPWRDKDPNPRPLLVTDTRLIVQLGASQPTILPRKDLQELEPVLLKEGIGALLAVPLVYQSRLLGRLMVYFNTPHEFTDTEVQLGQTIAAHVAFAIGRQRANDVLKAIVDGATPTTGGEFFRGLVRHLAKALNVRWAFVGESLNVEVDKIRTLALWADGDFAENFEYELAGTPCEGVMGRSMCCYPKGVAPMFPQDTLLKEMGVESYLGVRLSDSAGNSLGILVVLHDAPLAEPMEAESILSVFASRASAELERVRTEKRLLSEQRWFADMADQIGEAFHICQAETGQICQTNKALQTLLGYTFEELQQTTVHSLISADHETVDRYLSAHREGHRFTKSPALYRTKCGDIMEVEASTSLFVSDNQEYLFVVIRTAEPGGLRMTKAEMHDKLIAAGAA